MITEISKNNNRNDINGNRKEEERKKTWIKTDWNVFINEMNTQIYECLSIRWSKQTQKLPSDEIAYVQRRQNSIIAVNERVNVRNQNVLCKCTLNDLKLFDK